MPRFEIDVRLTFIIDAETEGDALEKVDDIIDHGVIDIDFVGFDKDIVGSRDITND